MYETFYGFSEKPFNLTPDPKYLYLSPRHGEAFAHLEFGRKERGGFIVITGEVGTGKSTLARYFLSKLPESTATAVVLYPALTANELLRSILGDLHVRASDGSLKELVDALHRFLLEARAAGREVILLIDEAQDLSSELLEQVRLISNLETDTEKLIQIVLMGQTELGDLLARHELRQLAQRVTARYHLTPLSRTETTEYVRHRLAVAGGEGKVSFTSGALATVHNLAYGVPRLINLICDRALLAGYVQGTRVVHPGMVKQAASEIMGAVPPRFRLGASAAGAIGGLAVGFLAALFLLPSRRPEAIVPAHAQAPMPEPTPSPVPSPAAMLDRAPSAEAGRLEPYVLTSPRAASLEASLAAVQGLWGVSDLKRTEVRTSLDQLRRFDLPAVLEMFHPGRRDTCFLALLSIDVDTALVAPAHQPPLRIALAEIDRLWTRAAVILWRDFDSVAGSASKERTEAWAQAALTRLGYPGDVPSAAARFQTDAKLVPDGLIGGRTTMALYALGPYPRPRLGTTGSAPASPQHP